MAQADGTAQAPAEDWWGPLDGPRPQRGSTAAESAQAAYPARTSAAFDEIGDAARGAARQRLEAMKRTSAARESQFAEEAASWLQHSASTKNQSNEQMADDEITNLLQDIRKATVEKHALEEKSHDNQVEIRRLELSLRQTDRAIGELEEQLANGSSSGRKGSATVATGAGSAAGSTTGELGPPSSAMVAVQLSTNERDEALDTYWRDCIATLESELRRKSARASDLHRRVHDLEGSLRQQLQANDDQVTSIQTALQNVWDSVKQLPSADRQVELPTAINDVCGTDTPSFNTAFRAAQA